MEFTIHALHLHRDITLPETGPAADGTSELYAYHSHVKKNDLEPAKADHLAEGSAIREIKAGYYLFTQGLLPEESREDAFRDAAEAIWLEALWQEADLPSDRIFVRILSEDSKTVFQVFREAARRQDS
jgi:hypothetical protein